MALKQKAVRPRRTPSRGFLGVEPLADGLANSAVYPDTCYLIRLANSGYSILDSLRRLSESTTVMLMGEVIDEFMRNARDPTVVDREFMGRALSDVAQLRAEPQINPNLIIENANVCGAEKARMAERMRKNSPKGNSRVGAGEAAIVSHIRTIIGLFDGFVILSSDSDVGMLIAGMPSVSVSF